MNSEKQAGRFARVYGSPGQGPRSLGPLRVFWPLAPICFAAGWLLHAALPFPRPTTSQAGFLFILLAILLAAFITWSARRLQSFLKGAAGEEAVARTLSFLPAGHTVFNDLQLDPSGPSFDHIVVAPAGIFVIETKNWSGTITVENGRVFRNGQTPSRPPLKQVKEEAAALLTHLTDAGCPDVPILPVLCFADSAPEDAPVNIGGVRICSAAELPGLFENTLETPLPAGTLNIISSELARFTES